MKFVDKPHYKIAVRVLTVRAEKSHSRHEAKGEEGREAKRFFLALHLVKIAVRVLTARAENSCIL